MFMVRLTRIAGVAEGENPGAREAELRKSDVERVSGAAEDAVVVVGLTLEDADASWSAYVDLSGHAQENAVFYYADGVVQLRCFGLQRTVADEGAIDDVMTAVGEVGGAGGVVT